MADQKAAVLDAVRSALAAEGRLDMGAHPITLAFSDGTLTLQGEVASVAAKKLALERAAAVPAVTGVVDRLHVAPAQRMDDAELGRLIRDALLQEPAFADFAIGQQGDKSGNSLREPPGTARGCIEIEIEDGVVTLNGRVPGLDDKRLAGVLAWWVPGSRDVINGIVVEPAEEDSDDKITEAVRLVLDKDPFVDAGQIRVGVRDAVVTLTGLLPTAAERDMAESDAWYVFAVDRVVNRIEVET